MAHIPSRVKRAALIPSMVAYLIGQGKVRDTYRIPYLSEALIQVATDRISIFDFVLPFTIPRKGEVLTALTNWWLTGPLANFSNHLLPLSDEGIRMLAKVLLNSHHDLPLERSLFVRLAEVIKLEFVYRMMLGGSGYKDYFKNNGVLAGVQLPLDLPRWNKFDEPFFTPSTKADIGHDENITQAEAYAMLGPEAEAMETLGRQAYQAAYDHAAKSGFTLLDTKLELGWITVGGKRKLALIDEVFTPDSSRLSTLEEWQTAKEKGKDPTSHDKQVVRDWGKTIKTPFKNKDDQPIVGIDKLKPENPEHLVFVDSLEAPVEIIQKTSAIYLRFFSDQVGISLDDYQPGNVILN